MYESPWHPARISALVFLWRAGLATKEIATLLGLSKGSILSKARRLKLGPHAAAVPLTPNPNPKPRNTGGGVAYAIKCRMQHVAKATKKPVAVVVSEPTSGSIGILDLARWHCRYIVSKEGEPYLFCGEHIFSGSYCAYHDQICYQDFRPAMPTRGHWRRR